MKITFGLIWSATAICAGHLIATNYQKYGLAVSVRTAIATVCGLVAGLLIAST